MSDATAETQPKLTPQEQLGLYGKAFAAAVVSGLTAYLAAENDAEGVTTADWITVVLAFLATFGIIWAIPNTPKFLAGIGKSLFAGLAAAGAALIPAFSDGHLSTPEIIAAVVAFLIGAGLTGTISNAASSDPVDTEGHLVAVPADVKQAMLSGPAVTRRLGPRVILQSPPVPPVPPTSQVA